MGNNWKAKCVKDYYGWKKGMIIEVRNGVVLESEMHGGGGLSPKEAETFEKWCDATNPRSWELITDETIETITDISGNTLSRVIENKQPDAINPSHYKECSLECIDAMLMAFGADHVYMFCCITAWKYMWRYQNKNGIEDIGKARWYIEKAKELGHDQPEVWNMEYVLEKIEKENEND